MYLLLNTSYKKQMNNLAEIHSLIKKGAKITIIGDSLAAGAGCSSCIRTNEVFLVDENNREYTLRDSPNSWWGRFQSYLRDNYQGCTVTNHGHLI